MLSGELDPMRTIALLSALAAALTLAACGPSLQQSADKARAEWAKHHDDLQRGTPDSNA